MKLDPRHLAQLSTIVEAGSFQMAADRLGLSQPAVSRNIRALEQRLGARVFDRSRRRAVPTKLGERLARSGLAIRVAEEQASTYSDLAVAGAAGELRIGAPPSVAGKFLTEPLSQFMLENPECMVDIRVGLIFELRTMLERGQIDLVIGPHTLAEQVAELEFTTLIEDQLGILCRADHPLVRQSAVSPVDLEQQSWVAHPRGSLIRQQTENALVAIAVNQIRTSCEVESARCLLEIVASTDLIAVMPIAPTRPYLDDRLTFLELDYVLLRRPIGVIRRRDALNNSVQVKFLKLLHRQFDDDSEAPDEIASLTDI